MRVFVTGATGNIGSRLVAELIGAGHQVIGLCRDPAKAAALVAAGAEPFEGSIAAPASLIPAAARTDAVVHLAFNHDFSRYLQNCEDDRAVIAALGGALAGSDRPLLVTSGTPVANTVPGAPALEGNPVASAAVHPRAATEEAAAQLLARGVNVAVMRLPQVHDPVTQGLITPLIAMYRAAGVCSYVGAGDQRWPAAHVTDVARAYRLAIERGVAGARYHAVAEEGVAMRDIVNTIGRRLGLPVESIAPDRAADRFGWMAGFAGLDIPASSAETRRLLGWQPTGCGLLEDLARLELPG